MMSSTNVTSAAYPANSSAPAAGFVSYNQQAASPAPTSSASGTSPTKVMLPQGAMQGARSAPSSWTSAPGPAASPGSKPMVTPHNVPTTAWRTVVCPFPPVRRARNQPGSLDPTPQSSPTGLMTPANLWPSPLGMASPHFRAMSTSGSAGSSMSVAGFAAGQASPFATDVTPILASGGTSATNCGAELVQFVDMMGPAMQMQGSEPPTPINQATPGATPSHLMSLDRARIFDGPPGGDTPNAHNAEKAAFGPFFTGAPAASPMAMMPDGSPQAWMRNLGA
mmetsp:Transcript_17763/g.31762  ORF Transcript_17763/g.31762 Transcript_17763/m.31762 type:complete len:280 (+) Transcript_17763:76-915(+)